MGKVTFKNQVDPSTPSSGYTELFVDSADKKIKTIDDAGTLTDLTSGGGGSPAGANTQIQFNNSGAFGADSGFTFNTAYNSLKCFTGSQANGAGTAGFTCGTSDNGYLNANGNGSWAGGDTYGGYGIYANNAGSLAFGYTNGSTITAGASGAIQFNSGTNNLANSLKVGDAGLRLSGNSGKPAGATNGDFWVYNYKVYVRTNNTDKDLGAAGGGGDAWSDAVDANIVPDADSTRNLGSSANHFSDLFVDQSVLGETGGGGNPAFYTSTGTVAGGYANAYSSYAKIGTNNAQKGSFAFGYCYSNGYPGYIETRDSGCWSGGFVSSSNSTTWIRSGSATYGRGSFAFGWAGTGGQIYAEKDGCFAIGQAEGGSITAGSDGSFAMGRTYSSGKIKTFAYGTIAGGVTDYSSYGTIYARGKGSIAFGWAQGGKIEAGASSYGEDGCLAFGKTSSSSYYIQANGDGNLAIGYANNANVRSTGSPNCFQFGEGTNTQENSLQVGSVGNSGLMLCADGQPYSLANGQFWVYSGNVYCRTGGYTRNLTNI